MLIRDREWKPYAILTSQIDLQFLSVLISKSRISSASYMFVVDEDGVIISHPKISVVANQVNVSRSNAAVAEVMEGNDGVREVKVSGSSFFAAYRQLKNLDRANLPGWGVLYMVPVSEVMPGVAYVFLQTLIWMAAAFFLLYYVNNLILSGLEEEWEA